MADSAPDQSQEHESYMQLALSVARQSPPQSTNFCVGAVLVDETRHAALYTGYTLELPGNMHAEECCLIKFRNEIDNGTIKPDMQRRLAIYTTMEPCNKRASGSLPCADKLIQTRQWGTGCAVERVYVGVQEPEKFVGANEGKKKLEEAGIEYVHVHVPGLEQEILKVATAGHAK